MFKQKVILLCFFIVLVLIYQLTQVSVTTLKYFPIDESATFDRTSTSLSIDQTLSNKPVLLWQLKSTHQPESFLAHDVGLLYQNGVLKGIQSSWSQNDNQLNQSISLSPKSNYLYQAISYHYLELHQSSNKINSNYQLSEAELYVLESNQSEPEFFQTPKTDQEHVSAQKIQQKINAFLTENWTRLIDDYDIDRQVYLEIPLSHLSDYKDKPLPGLTMTESKRVIAQLWEGLYQNYIIPSKEQQSHGGIMPIILLDKNLDHLYVLFINGDGENQQLIQKLSLN